VFFSEAVQILSDGLVSLAYPQACVICGGSVEQRRFGVACERCWSGAPILTGRETLCWKCGVPVPAEVAPDFCAEVRCRRCDSQSFTAARAVGLYEGALRESVLQLKRRAYVPEHIEGLLVVAAKREPLNVCTRIVPVPLHEERLRARGFNQASIIAQVLAKSLRLPVDEVSLVRLYGSEKYRAGLDAKGRLDTVAGAFAVPNPRLVAGESILLVDDVFTTGATVSACAGALIQAGAENVFVLTLATVGAALRGRPS
jgi:ComF family protein